MKLCFSSIEWCYFVIVLLSCAEFLADRQLCFIFNLVYRCVALSLFMLCILYLGVCRYVRILLGPVEFLETFSDTALVSFVEHNFLLQNFVYFNIVL